MLDLEDAKRYIKEQFEETGDSSWLEGWICGYTDFDHGYPAEESDAVHDELFDYLHELRGQVVIPEWSDFLKACEKMSDKELKTVLVSLKKLFCGD